MLYYIFNSSQTFYSNYPFIYIGLRPANLWSLQKHIKQHHMHHFISKLYISAVILFQGWNDDWSLKIPRHYTKSKYLKETYSTVIFPHMHPEIRSNGFGLPNAPINQNKRTDSYFIIYSKKIVSASQLEHSIRHVEPFKHTQWIYKNIQAMTYHSEKLSQAATPLKICFTKLYKIHAGLCESVSMAYCISFSAVLSIIQLDLDFSEWWHV